MKIEKETANKSFLQNKKQSFIIEINKEKDHKIKEKIYFIIKQNNFSLNIFKIKHLKHLKNTYYN